MNLQRLSIVLLVAVSGLLPLGVLQAAYGAKGVDDYERRLRELEMRQEYERERAELRNEIERERIDRFERFEPERPTWEWRPRRQY